MKSAQKQSAINTVNFVQYACLRMLQNYAVLWHNLFCLFVPRQPVGHAFDCKQCLDVLLLLSSLVYLLSVAGLYAEHVPFTSSATAVLEQSLF